MTRPNEHHDGHAPLRIGILGAARIARQFVGGVAGSLTVVVTAVASRDRARAAAFVADLQLPHVCDDYQALLESPHIDAIYNPLPNGLHGVWSIRAMQAGKHVLCEKPLAASAAEARAMYAAARAAGVTLVEAYPYRAQEQTIRLHSLIADGAIGRLRTIHAAFGFPLRDRDDIRLDPVLAGGALMDLGSYPLSLIRYLTGEAPQSLHAVGTMDPSGVDDSALVTLTFGSGVLAQAACSFSTVVHRQALIVGDEGLIETTYANHTTEVAPVLRLRRGSDRRAPVEEIRVAPANGFRAEAESFADAVRGGRWSGITEVESIDVAVMLDAARAQVAYG